MAKKTTGVKQNSTAAEIQVKASKVNQALWRASNLFDIIGILWDSDCVDDFDYSEYLDMLRGELTSIIRETVSGAAIISADVSRYLHEQNCPGATKPSLVTPAPVTAQRKQEATKRQAVEPKPSPLVVVPEVTTGGPRA